MVYFVATFTLFFAILIIVVVALIVLVVIFVFVLVLVLVSSRAHPKNVIDVLIGLLLTLATPKQMLVPYTETVLHFPVFDEHVLQDVEVGRHKLRLAVAYKITSANLPKPT
jgi:steroid 5-alpha reductase family enzyme